MNNRFDQHYWTSRWQSGETGWDAGAITHPFVPFIDQLTDRDLRILIPGSGSAYEGEYLWKKGFSRVEILDISEVPLKHFQERVPDFPKDQLRHTDFFSLTGTYDLILEQTFFCALDPSMRPHYASKMHDLLRSGGTLAGLLFNFPLTEEGPPFGGSHQEYQELFEPLFEIKKMEESRNSIQPRQGRELWVELIRPD